MRVSNLIKLEIYIDSEWVNFSDGIIYADIVRGIQSTLIGPWQQIESGVLSLVSRNENLDPYFNSDIRMNKNIRILADEEPIFTGRINGINVDYQPKGEPPTITLTAVDMIGTMALHTLRDTFKERLGSTMSLFGMFQELVYCNEPDPAGDPYPISEIIGFTNPYRVSTGYGNARNASSGTSALTMAATLGQSNLDFFYADRNNDVYLYPSAKVKRDEDPKLQLDSRGGATSYRTVELTDGFDLLKNKISFSAYGTTVPVYTNEYSVNQWGPQQAVINVYLQDTDTSALNNLVENIFEDTANPTREIAEVSFDGNLAPDDVHTIDILDNIYIYHEVNGFDIARKYGIVGIHHKITANDWDVTYNLRNMFTYETVFPTPEIAVEPESGTTADTYTFTITNLDDISSENATYVWKLNGVQFSTSEVATRTFTSLQTGTKTVTCTVTDDYGFVKESDPLVFQVYGAPPTGVSFTYSVDASDSSLLQFTATATNATVYTWDFGDGGTGSGIIVGHKYSTSGSKTVVLTATNPDGSTTSTQTISVTVPETPPNEVGTQGVRYLKIGMDQFNGSGTYYRVMTNLRALTSSTAQNRASANKIRWCLPYQVVGEPYGNHLWKNPAGADATDLQNIGYVNSIRFQDGSTGNNNYGLTPYNTISGTANWSLIIDLGAIYYDIKTIDIEVSGTYSLASPTFLNLYATDYVEAALGAGTKNPNTVNWTKIGTIARSNGDFTPLSGITMPLNIEDL